MQMKGKPPTVLGQDALLHFLCWESIRKIFLDMWAGLTLAWLISTMTSGTPLSQALHLCPEMHTMTKMADLAKELHD